MLVFYLSLIDGYDEQQKFECIYYKYRNLMYMVKKSLLILLTFAMMAMVFLGGFTTAYAIASTEHGDISLFISYISTTSPTLSFSGSTASLNCEVRGIYGTTTKIIVTGILQRKVSGRWVNESSTSQTVNNYRMTYSRSTSAEKGYTYRAKYVVKAYDCVEKSLQQLMVPTLPFVLQ